MNDHQFEPDNSQPQTKTWGKIVGTSARVLLRVGAICGAVFTLWIIVGSIWFPEWWYAAIWRADLLNIEYFNYGWSYLLDSDRWLLLCIVAIAATATMYCYFKRSKLIAILDRIAIPAIIVCAALVVSDALLLHQQRYEDGVGLLEWFSGSVTPTMLEDALLSKPAPHQITPPVDFHYIDSARVNGVYSEIEPDLVETERTTSSTKKRGGSAGIDAGPATLKGETSKEKEETSKYERSDMSPERKCVEIMNFVLNKGSAHYYTSEKDFYIERAYDDAIGAARIASEKAKMKYDPSVYAQIPPIGDLPIKLNSEQRRAAAKQIGLWNQKFRQEAQGFVVVDGIFHITRVNGNIVFEEEFSPRPQQIVFRFTLPASFDSDAFLSGYRMRVFGDVVQGTDDLKTLTIHPLAVFSE